MQGANISANYADRASAAREAGCDFALICNNRAGVIQAIDQLPHAQHQIPQEKWGRMAGDFSRRANKEMQLKSARELLETYFQPASTN
jgi:beta-N-acetylhexosaminidase